MEIIASICLLGSEAPYRPSDQEVPGSNPLPDISFLIKEKPKSALTAEPYNVGRWERYRWIALGMDYMIMSILSYSLGYLHAPLTERPCTVFFVENRNQRCTNESYKTRNRGLIRIRIDVNEERVQKPEKFLRQSMPTPKTGYRTWLARGRSGFVRRCL